MSDISDQRKYIERMIGEIAYMYREQFDQLNAENAKLREEVEQWHRLTAGIELPEYPITQFQPKDLERENTKLRELVRDMFRDFAHADCELKSRCGRTFMAVTRYEPRLRELGVEVD